MDSDQGMIELHNDIGQFIGEKLKQEHRPLSVAAILMTNSLRIYRTVLSDEDYESVVQMILDRRNEVDPYLPIVLQ